MPHLLYAYNAKTVNLHLTIQSTKYKDKRLECKGLYMKKQRLKWPSVYKDLLFPAQPHHFYCLKIYIKQNTHKQNIIRLKQSCHGNNNDGLVSTNDK